MVVIFKATECSVTLLGLYKMFRALTIRKMYEASLEFSVGEGWYPVPDHSTESKNMFVDVIFLAFMR